MNLLIVEDEERVRTYLELSLKPIANQVSTCKNMDELRAYMGVPTTNPPSLIILDRLLQGTDSGSSIDQIKERFPESPILILSAIGSSFEKSKMLDSGADDYLSKPFSLEELISRIRALHRRKQKRPSYILRSKDLSLNLVNQTAEVNNQKLDLSRKEYQLLCLLIENPSRVFNRYQILDRIWDINVDVESNVVEVTMKNLRKKLESAKSRIEILSKRHVGYWIEA